MPLALREANEMNALWVFGHNLCHLGTHFAHLLPHRRKALQVLELVNDREICAWMILNTDTLKVKP